MAAGCRLQNGVDRRSDPRSARIVWVAPDRLRLEAPNIHAAGQPQIYLHFDHGASRYFFASPPIRGGGETPLDLALPDAIYESERRDLERTELPAGEIQRVRLQWGPGGAASEARVHDWSYQGLGLQLDDPKAGGPGDRVEVEFLGGPWKGERRYGEIRHRRALGTDGGVQLGVLVSAVEPAPPFPVETRERILDGGLRERARRRLVLTGAMARALPGRVLRRKSAVQRDQGALELVRYPNDRGQEICGLVDRALGGQGGTAVVIPPAWGRTKETFLPLARTLVACFEAAGEPATVLRFDGTHRRGESYIDPECRAPGDEYLHFRFSQAVQDIEASLDFLESRPDIAPERIVLVSFSLGSVEGRRALARDAGRRVAGWISVVGMVDLQSGLRTVSGGVDYAYGITRNVTFGRHELVGVVSDMDLTGRDAFEHELVLLEDAKRDMAKIQVPVTWMHGRHDAWMELDRVRTLLSAGDTEGRRLIEIPAGHQMRSSREALETFQLVSGEALRMATGRTVSPQLPDLDALDLRTRAERARRPRPDLQPSRFWEDYLLGRDRRFGFELMSATTPYRDLMELQIERLALGPDDHVIDLGSGTGDFAIQLARHARPAGLRVTQLDLVPGALGRGRQRLERVFPDAPFRVARLAADLELDGYGMPLAPGSADAIIASLLLSYVEDPHRLLCAMCELLRPGGRLVLSSMRRDADISRIYVDSIAELPPDRRRAHFGVDSDEFDEIQRVFLNDASKLLQLEEDGRFHFWDADELAEMCHKAGLEPIASDASFGTPPQAVIVTARRSSS